MTTKQQGIIKDTWLTISKMNDKAVGNLFYNKLFAIAPEVRPLFLNAVPEQSKKLMVMLHYMVRNVEQPEEISHAISSLARRHVGYKVKSYHYAIVGNALLWTLEQGLGAAWNEEVEEAWATFYSLVSNAMVAVHDCEEAMA